MASSLLAKLGRTRAPREQVRLFAWTLFFHLSRIRERSDCEAIRVRGRYRCSEPSGNSPSSRPSPRTRGEGARKRRQNDFICPPPRAARGRMGDIMRRKLSAPEWRFPRRMTMKQWSVLPYRERHAYLAQAQCTLLEYWRDCANAAAAVRVAVSFPIRVTGSASRRCRQPIGRGRKPPAGRCARCCRSAPSKARKACGYFEIVAIRPREAGEGDRAIARWRGPAAVRLS